MTRLKKWEKKECDSRSDPCDRHHQVWVADMSAMIDLCGGYEEDGQLGWLIDVRVFHSDTISKIHNNQGIRFPVASTTFTKDVIGSLEEAQREAALAYWQVVEVLDWNSLKPADGG